MYPKTSRPHLALRARHGNSELEFVARDRFAVAAVVVLVVLVAVAIVAMVIAMGA